MPIKARRGPLETICAHRILVEKDAELMLSLRSGRVCILAKWTRRHLLWMDFLIWVHASQTKLNIGRPLCLQWIRWMCLPLSKWCLFGSVSFCLVIVKKLFALAYYSSFSVPASIVLCPFVVFLHHHMWDLVWESIFHRKNETFHFNGMTVNVYPLQKLPTQTALMKTANMKMYWSGRKRVDSLYWLIYDRYTATQTNGLKLPKFDAVNWENGISNMYYIILFDTHSIPMCWFACVLHYKRFGVSLLCIYNFNPFLIT